MPGYRMTTKEPTHPLDAALKRVAVRANARRSSKQSTAGDVRDKLTSGLIPITSAA
jgi:hypothetical protein